MVEQVKLKSLKCTICHDVFKAPTSLNCGHSFCKVCLEQYDEHSSEQHRIDGVMECPNCRQLTKLEESRVAGLSTNYSLAGVGEELDITADVKSSDNCSLHNQIFNDIFCLVCKKFICVMCLSDVAHEGHSYKKKEEMAVIVEKSRNATIKKMEEKKRKIRKYTTTTKKRKRDVDSHLDKLEMEMENSSDKKIEIIRGNKKRLSKRINDIRNNSDKVMADFIGRQKQLMQSITVKTARIGQEGIAGTSTSKLSDSDELNTLYREILDLKRESERDIDDPSIADALQEVENTQFFSADDNDLDLGTFEQEASDSEQDDQDASDQHE